MTDSAKRAGRMIPGYPSYVQVIMKESRARRLR